VGAMTAPQLDFLFVRVLFSSADLDISENTSALAFRRLRNLVKTRRCAQQENPTAVHSLGIQGGEGRLRVKGELVVAIEGQGIGIAVLPCPTRLVYVRWNVDPLNDGLGTREGHRRIWTPLGCVLAPGGLPKALSRGSKRAPK
jgi:hypothetical protein